ncbi:hypothetical protein MFAL_38740 [Mycolicibacterium fallax]|nr:hypothetical protein MFAL_38740 [Mycolicibacterium fallax]
MVVTTERDDESVAELVAGRRGGVPEPDDHGLIAPRNSPPDRASRPDPASSPDRPRADLADRDDVYLLLSTFYGRALVDALLQDPFEDIRAKGLESHLPVMCDFWETMLFRARKYRGSALTVHKPIHTAHPLTSQHFIRWLSLWMETVDELFAGPIAEQAKIIGRRTAWAMHRALVGHDADDLDDFVDREALIIR